MKAVTANDVRKWLRSAMVTYRSRRNPLKQNGDCCYTSRSGRHCIVGQFIIDQGGKAPAYGSFWNDAAFAEMEENYDTGLTFSPGAKNLMDRLQAAADRSAKDPKDNEMKLPKWPVAIKNAYPAVDK